MNPIVRHFLPSQVRGVYRFDDTFNQIDNTTYQQFFDAKSRFLPEKLREKFMKHISLTESYTTTCKSFFLDVPFRGKQTRASIFFKNHQYFANALQGSQAINGADNFLEIQFVKKVLAPLLTIEGLAIVQPQKQIGPYFADFAIEGSAKFVLEIDGFGKFQTRHDLDNFIERQNHIVCNGWKIIRFTYGQIMDTPERSIRVLSDVLKDDDFLSRHLISTNQQGTLFDKVNGLSESDKTIFDLVNGFYHIQDWLIEFVCTQKSGENHDFVLYDDFGFKLPFVAIALSDLYRFLNTVTKFVDIKFKLPHLKVISPVISHEWTSFLHQSISVIPSVEQPVGAMIKLNAQVVQNYSASLPTPVPTGEYILFRKGLSLENIHQGLDYISQEIFRYPGTKPFQDKILQRTFNGEDILGIATTGSGKSFCFWLPSLLKPGLTLVISPLRSLMRDQKLTLLNYGIASVEFINSDVKPEDQLRYMKEAELGYLRLLYIAPERLRIKKFVDALEKLQKSIPVNILAVDEAHCISEWGHDFRPSYLKLPAISIELTKQNTECRLIALTATAGEQVEKDILRVLRLSETNVIRDTEGADRKNFSYQIISNENTYKQILQKDLPKALKLNSLRQLLDLKNKHGEKTVGLVFCIYADPHGKSTILDGTTHYLFETMKILEPDKIFMNRRGNYPKYNLDAFSKGNSRAFASKPPTLCPNCYSYQYTSADGQKVCLRCGNSFPTTNIHSVDVKRWEKIITSNQNDFKDGNVDILVATKGFGMGIDKSSVRFVIHTSLASGIESWYQEVGRAGRDNERAHIVLIVDPPDILCKRELEKLSGPKRPACNSWQGGCPYGRQSICDYGKQHMFINRSYPGAETDAIGALHMLDKLVKNYDQAPSSLLYIYSSNENISRHELQLYRLMTLGLVSDYTVKYNRGSPIFEVKIIFQGLPANVGMLETTEKEIQSSLIEYTKHWCETESDQINKSLLQKYNPLEHHQTKINQKFSVLPNLTPLFNEYQYAFFKTVYKYLLLMLDHTYKDIVKMRYDMLWNLLSVVNSSQDNICQRVKILPHFEKNTSLDNNYKCGCCNVCRPNLDFEEYVQTRPENPNIEASERELNEIFDRNDLDIPILQNLCEIVRDYKIAQYTRARAILEGNPNNLPALFVTREFSPAPELEANTKRLLQTANECTTTVTLTQLQELFDLSDLQFQPDLLYLLNEQNTLCDTPEGWNFLFTKAKQFMHTNLQLLSMHDCLDFFLLVDEMLPKDTDWYSKKAYEMEKKLNA